MRRIACLAPALLLTMMSPLAHAQKAVYLVRHAEKAEDYKPKDLGEDAAWPLSEVGEAQAEALADRLAGVGITAIYVSRFEHGKPIERTRNTAEPLRKRLADKGVKVAVHEIPFPETMLPKSLEPGELVRILGELETYAAGVREMIRKDHPDGVVLIVGHDNTVPAILKALGHPGEVFLGPKEFDHLFAVMPRDGQFRPDAAPWYFHLGHYAPEVSAGMLSPRR